MQAALEQAQIAYDGGEIPIGAVLVHNNKIIGRGYNQREQTKNPLHHAEMLALENGTKTLGDWRLKNSTLYVTLEPCPMCLGALLQARVGHLVYECLDDKRTNICEFLGNGQTLTWPGLSQVKQIVGNNHTITVTGPCLEQECLQLLQSFFRNRRTQGT